VGLSILLYLILFATAPLLARMFHDPLIEPVSRVLFLSLLLNAAGIIQQTLLIRKADFRGMTKVNMSALFIAGVVAIVMALTGYGVWALVMQTLLFAFSVPFSLDLFKMDTP